MAKLAEEQGMKKGNIKVNYIWSSFYHWTARVICILTFLLHAFIMDYYMVGEYGTAPCQSNSSLTPDPCTLENNTMMATFHYDYLQLGWLAADFVCLGLFLLATASSVRHFRRIERWHGHDGSHPLGYLAWIVFSAQLCARVAILYRAEVQYLQPTFTFGPNTLRLGLALVSIIFFNLVLMHNDVVEDNSEQSNFIDGLISGITLDLLDAVSILDVLFLYQSHIMLGYEMQTAVIAVACLVFMLPTIPLMMLSKTRYGKDRMAKYLHIAYTVLRMLCVDMSLLVIRLILWNSLSQNVSVFAIKNVLSVATTVKRVHDEVISARKEENKKKKEDGGGDGGTGGDVEMSGVA